jgi:hypothetical protein
MSPFRVSPAPSRILTPALMCVAFLLGAVTFLLGAGAGCIPTLYLAPDGDDAWSGTLSRPNRDRTDGPLASLAGARDAIRRARGAGTGDAGSVRVVVEDGIYPMTGPLVLEPQDGGTEKSPIVYEAAEGARPVFDGGRRIAGFRVTPDGTWEARIPAAGDTAFGFEQLFVNGRRAMRARSPNLGTFKIRAPLESGIDPLTGRTADLSRRGFIAYSDDVGVLAGKSSAELRDVQITVYHAWEASLHRVASVDAKTGAVITTGPATWPFLSLGDGQRYVIENYREALDQPGEWFLDSSDPPTGTLRYIPLPGEDPASADVIAPVAQRFITIQGTPDRKVAHVTFRGLTFRHSRFVLEPEGHSDPQAAVTVRAVIMANHAEHVRFDGCKVEGVAGYGIWFWQGCRNCAVERCEFRDLGAGGIRIGEQAVRPEVQLRTERITADNNIVTGAGRIFPGAVGIWIGCSPMNRIAHNDVGDMPYTGISAGWSWGYDESGAFADTIESNLVHDIGLGVLSDLAGIYTLGLSPGTLIRGNVVRDVDSYDRYGRGGWGIYCDEGSSGITIEDNLVYRTKTGGFHQNTGRENVIRNNIFALGRDGQIQRSKRESHISFTFAHNIVYWDGNTPPAGPGDEALHGRFSDSNFRMDQNLYWDTSGRTVTFNSATFAEWQASGKDTGSIVADPLFVDPARGDFRLKDGSPASRIGFRAFDFGAAGLELR